MKAVVLAANEGMPVIGICNGFQILCEAGLLPGALIRNQSLHFVCKPVWLRVETDETPFTANLKEKNILRMPVAHGEGSYFADEETLTRWNQKNRWFFVTRTSSGMSRRSRIQTDRCTISQESATKPGT